MLASASDAVIIGFNVRPLADARRAAEREGVDIRTYSVIYKITEDLRKAMEGMLEPEEVEQSLGEAEVLQIFKASRIGRSPAASSPTARSPATPGSPGPRRHVIWDGNSAPSRFKDDVREVEEGFECGIALEGYQDVKVGDVLEAFETKQVEQTLE